MRRECKVRFSPSALYWAGDIPAVSAEVVQLIDRVPERREVEVYNGYEIVYKYDRDKKVWAWHFDKVTRLPFSGTAKDIEKAKKEAHKNVDKLINASDD